jgi:peptide/bleomycin uptake transporter
MSFYYMTHWTRLRNIEGASQRVQEDAQRFANIVEGLAVSFVDSIMTLLVFLPLLWQLSSHITALPLVGPVDASLVWVALLSAAVGTVLLGLIGFKLPGLEFQNQRVEAAFRKELVYGEDHPDRARPLSTRDFFLGVQRNYFRLYGHYLYFNVARYIYIQGSIFVPLVVMAPSIAAGALTLGLFQQVSNAFGQVEDSFRFLANSWTTIISLISVYKRLSAFESNIPAGAVSGVDYDDPRYLDTEAQFPPPGTSSSPPVEPDPTNGGTAPLPSGA